MENLLTWTSIKCQLYSGQNNHFNHNKAIFQRPFLFKIKTILFSLYFKWTSFLTDTDKDWNDK